MLSIEVATADHAVALTELIRRNAHEAYAPVADATDIDAWLDDLHGLEHVRSRIDDPQTLQFALVEEGAGVGSASASHKGAGVASHLGALYLEPHVRGRG